MGWRESVLQRFGQPAGGPATMPEDVRDGRFPSLTYFPHPVNPYHPNVVRNSFPIVTLPMGPYTPPSINPQRGAIRQGPTPKPTGTTVPAGAIGTLKRIPAPALKAGKR